MESRWTHLGFAAALALLAWVYVRFEPLQWAHYTDPVVYLSGAQSLAQGDGYRSAPYVNAPRISCHPPLQSAYLSLFWRVAPEFPANLRLLYGAMILLSLATFVLFWWLARRSGLPAGLALAFTLAWGLTAAWGTLLYAFFSDILFCALWLGLGLYWVHGPDPRRARTWAITGVLLSLLYLTRSAAVPLIGVVGLALLARWRRGGGWMPAAVCLLPVLAVMVGWKLYRSGAPGYADFALHTLGELGGWPGWAGVVASNAFYYGSGLGFLHSFLPSLMNMPASASLAGTVWSSLLTVACMVAGWGFTACWVFGCWRRGTALDRLGGWMVAAYLVQLTLYPTELGERALYPVLPFVLIWAWKGRSLICRWPGRERVLIGATALFLLLNATANGVGFSRAMGYLAHSDFVADLAEIGDWLRANTPPEAVVAASLSEPVFHLHHCSGRRVVENYFQPQPWFSIVSHSLPRSPAADYLLLSWYSSMRPEEANTRFALVAQSSRLHFRLYRPATITEKP